MICSVIKVEINPPILEVFPFTPLFRSGTIQNINGFYLGHLFRRQTPSAIAQERHKMALYRVRPTQTDVEIANAVSAHTSPKLEQIASVLTWGADEHVLCALAAGWWLYSRTGNADERRNSKHILLTTVAVTVIPHILKAVFDQRRPDRLTVRGHLHGVPFSGNQLDAFPSGHAIHVGALASAATVFPREKRNLIWTVSTGLVLTRIVLLAHWTSDVMAGLAIGALTERLLRFWTGYGSTTPFAISNRRHRLS
jgi:PAP2 superfamily